MSGTTMFGIAKFYTNVRQREPLLHAKALSFRASFSARSSGRFTGGLYRLVCAHPILWGEVLVPCFRFEALRSSCFRMGGHGVRRSAEPLYSSLFFDDCIPSGREP
jgi:hypothetical protein